MQMAIDEMLKSRSEHVHKFDPLVGAILVGPTGKLVEKTHRAGLRVGDHAEYTLLERLLASENLEGSVLYVTLEPCTKREPPKIPCVERIVAARIKKVWIGMLDPNPDIQGHGVDHLQQNGVEVEFFDLDLMRKIREENKEFAEQYEKARDVIDYEHDYEGPSEKEKEAVGSASLSDLSMGVIESYLKARGKKFARLARMWEFLNDNGFVTHVNKHRSHVPTVAGLLLFGKSPEDFLVQSKVKAEFRSNTRSAAVDIAGPLLLIPEKVRVFLDDYMRTYTEIKGFKRTEQPEYPWEAIREAVVNAIVHRGSVLI